MYKLFVSFALMLFCPCMAYAEVWGEVVADHYNCTEGASDRIVVATKRGFTLAEVYSGYSATHEGKLISGNLHSYGFTEIFDESQDEVGRIYVDDFLASKRTAQKWCWG